MNRYVITGGPGVGKTTVIDGLRERGFLVLPEAARMIVEEEREKGSEALPWIDLAAFQQLVAKRQLKLEEAAEAEGGDAVFLDRGLVDGMAYCLLGGVPAPNEIAEYGRGRYTKVFVLEPLGTYRKDDVRFEDEQDSARIHQELRTAYEELGYHLVDVLVMAPHERISFILDVCGLS